MGSDNDTGKSDLAPRHRTAADVMSLAKQLTPDLAHAVDLKVLIENPFDLEAEHNVSLDAPTGFEPITVVS